ncbi:MAG: penicillin-binding protein [Actinobacteria bacterium]|nr:penicillin-binding protein [Actinomycetota bacterium]
MRRRKGNRRRPASLRAVFPRATVAAAPRTGRGRVRRAARAGTVFVVGTVGVGLLAGLILAPAAMAAGLGAIRGTDLWDAIPVEVPFDAPLPQRSVMVDRNGEVFATLFAEDRIPVTREQLSPLFVDALLATEDARFYEHNGVDVLGTGRALLNNALGGDRQGASTITQQWVKNLTQAAAETEAERDAADDVSINRKITEARAAAAAEAQLSKDEILTRYVNTAFYGAGAYGIGAAAARYYSTTPENLTLNQAAMLAGVLNSPGLFDPLVNPEAAKERRDQVLDRMVEEGFTDAATATATKELPLELAPSVPPNGCALSTYPVYCQWVKESITNDPSFGPTPEARADLLYRGGLRIETPLDPQVQAAAQGAAEAALEATNRVAAGIAVIQPGTGQVLALATNRPWGSDEAAGQTEVLYPVLPNFQPGSTFKPITLAAAVEGGFSTKTVWNAPERYIPANLNYPDGGFANADDGPGGLLTAEQATWRSVNTYYVWLIEQTGVLKTAEMAQRLGMDSISTEGGPEPVGPRDASLTLGDFNTSPLQVANVYATFASGGVKCNPIGVTALIRDGSEQLPVASADCTQVLDPAVAATINTVLQNNVDGSDPLRTAQGGSIGRPVIGKTGTAGDFAAAWFAGATPQMATAVWMGDPRGGVANPMVDVVAFGQFYKEMYGGQAPAQLWQQTMAAAHEGRPVAQFPPGNKPSLPSVLVPNVVGMPLDSALGALTEAGFTVQISPDTAVAAQQLPPDYVVAMDPVPGTPRKSGTPVMLTLSPGSRTDVQLRQ